jgi:hypothetical protein
MRLYNIYGKLRYKNVQKYLINWDGKSRSKPQFEVKQFLKKYWITSVCYEEFPVYGTLMRIDLFNANKKIAVEVNGKQHGEFNPFFHNNSRLNYLNSLKRDHNKWKWLELNNIQLLEIEEEEVDYLSTKYIKEKFDINII